MAQIALRPQLLDAIYDSAVDARPWADVLPLLTRSIDCGVGSILSEDQLGNFCSLATEGVDSSAGRDYLAHYHSIDFVYPASRALGTGIVFTYCNLVTGDAYRKNPYSQEWLKRGDTGHIIGFRLEAAGGWEIGFGVSRSARQHPFDRNEIAFFHDLLPHFDRAQRLRSLISSDLTTDRAELTQAQGWIIIVDREMVVRSLSSSAEAAIRRGSLPISISGNRIRAKAAHDDDHLRRLVAVAAGAAGISPSTASYMTNLGSRRYRVVSVPLSETGAVSLGLMAKEPWVAITVVSDVADLSASNGTGRHRPAGPFRLSPTQAAVLDLLAEGLTAREIAEVRCISADTVRQHIKAVLRKVGARNQKQLLTIVRESPSASAG